MLFHLSTWLQRKRVQAEHKFSGRTVQVHRITNPYHAVSIETGAACPLTAQKFSGLRFLAAEAPRLPQPTCSRQDCRCRYVHHEDRRASHDRRIRDVWSAARLQAHAAERRVRRGRRASDH